MKPRILLIDDLDTFAEDCALLLGDDGYAVSRARSAVEARALLGEADPWDVILLDQKLRGPGSRDEGLDLLSEAKCLQPEAQVILVTAYASPEAVDLAFDRGAFDYLDKSGAVFSTLLRVKIRNALALVYARTLPRWSTSAHEARLRATWQEARTERDPHRKGERLERVVELLLTSIAGFTSLGARRRSNTEEIDVMVRNEVVDEFMRRQGDYILVECKNWTQPVGDDQARSFLWKLHHRYGRARLGLFVAMSGVTAPFRETIRLESPGDKLVLLLDAEGLDAWINAPDRVAHLKDLIDRAVV